MSRKFKFLCHTCFYNEVVAGGEAFGTIFSSRTYQCLNCEILFDWYVALHYKPEDLNEIPFCSVCFKPEIVEWDAETGVCPKCSRPMDIVAQLKFLWD